MGIAVIGKDSVGGAPGVRVRRTVGSAVTRYVYDGDDLLLEVNGSGVLQTEVMHARRHCQDTTPSETGEAMRAVLLLLLTSSCLTAHETRFVSQPGGSTPEQQASGVELPDTVVCVSRSNGARLVKARHDPTTGELTLEAQDTGFVYRRSPPPYADTLDWFIRREPVVFGSRSFFWNGLPRQLVPEEIVQVGVKDGVAIFAEGDYETAGLGVLFVPISEGCEYQPYYHFENHGPVRPRDASDLYVRTCQGEMR